MAWTLCDLPHEGELHRLRLLREGCPFNIPRISQVDHKAYKCTLCSDRVAVVGTLLVTGTGLWEAGLGYFENLLGFKATIGQKRWAAVIHASAAVLAIANWIIHVYAAIWVRGTISAMTRGTVSGGWGWRQHRKWLRVTAAE